MNARRSRSSGVRFHIVEQSSSVFLGRSTLADDSDTTRLCVAEIVQSRCQREGETTFTSLETSDAEGLQAADGVSRCSRRPR